MTSSAIDRRTPPPAAAANAGTGPEKSGLVLLSLILVAAVANLNLSVANVALPDIGKAFDASQTALDLVAVGYSLGLAASVLWLGALGDRYGRKLMLILGILLSIPACIVAATAPSIEILIARPDRRRHLCRHGLPDDPRPDRRPVVRACPDPVDRPVVGPRWGDRGTRTRWCRASCSSTSSGARSSSSPCRWRSSRWSWPSGSCRPTSTRRPRRSTTSAGSCRPR